MEMKQKYELKQEECD